MKTNTRNGAGSRTVKTNIAITAATGAAKLDNDRGPLGLAKALARHVDAHGYVPVTVTLKIHQCELIGLARQAVLTQGELEGVIEHVISCSLETGCCDYNNELPKEAGY
jgi:hypothetical protein